MSRPPAKNPRIPKLRHQKSRDLAVVRIAGRDVYLGPFGSAESREKYARVVGEWLASGADSVRSRAAGGPAPSLTIDKLILAYWRYAEGYYRKSDGSPGSEPDKIKLAVRPLRRMYGTTPAADFGPIALKAVRQSMVDAGLARITVNQRIARIVRVFEHAVEDELIPSGKVAELKSVKGLRAGRSGARESNVIRPVAAGDVEAIRPHVSRQVWTMVELQRLTGMRSGEVTALRTIDLDTSGPVWTFTPPSHKTGYHGHTRTVYIGPRAQALVGPWLRTDPEGFLFQPREAMAEIRAARRAARKTPLTPSQRARKPKSRPRKTAGYRYDSRAYAHAIAKGCDKAFPHPELAGIKPADLADDRRAELKAWRVGHRWHPHQLRHTAATHIRKEFGLDVARIILGHRSPGVTARYAEADASKAVAAMEATG
jgi:integrase